MDDRLYLVEEKDEDEDVDGELVNPQLQGRRIFATSLQGDTLQVYTRVRAQCVEGHTFKSLCYFDGRLCWRPSKTWSRSMLWGSAPGWSLRYLAHHSRALALRWAVFAPPTPPPARAMP